jgi:23S rRNA pseudouridine2605 synthase
VRLNAFLARAGVASRRGADVLIQAGRVSVNGAPAQIGMTIHADDVVMLDERVLQLENYAYVLLNKPGGTITTASDPQGRPTVTELVERPERLFPVGRLDADTTGAILLTNDGELAHRLAHPSFGVEKAYLATVVGVPDARALSMLASGVDLDDGTTSPAQARVVRQSAGDSVVELILHEGRKHQVKRMLAAVGHPVKGLERARYAMLTVKGLAPAEWRDLTSDEVDQLRRITTR